MTTKRASSARPVPKRWRGKNFERVDREPMERLFAERWAKQCDTFGVFDYLFGENGWPVREENVGPRDREIAATVMQWLGSPVGQMFLHETLDEAGKRGIGHRISASPLQVTAGAFREMSDQSLQDIRAALEAEISRRRPIALRQRSTRSTRKGR